jgi:SH3-like domain-containing protein
MTILLVVTIAGISLLSLKGARGQQEVKPPAVPPMLETPRPLDNLETKEPAAPRNTPVSRKSIGKKPAAPQNTPVTMKSIGKERANVRAKPNLKSEILFQVFRGYPIKVKKKKNDWVYVTDHKHNSGWVYKPIVSSIKTVVVLAENANIRKGPSLKGPVVKQASEGEIYKLFAEKGRWVKVGYYPENEVIGWIRDDLVWGE